MLFFCSQIYLATKRHFNKLLSHIKLIFLSLALSKLFCSSFSFLRTFWSFYDIVFKIQNVFFDSNPNYWMVAILFLVCIDHVTLLRIDESRDPKLSQIMNRNKISKNRFTPDKWRICWCIGALVTRQYETRDCLIWTEFVHFCYRRDLSNNEISQPNRMDRLETVA